MSAPSRHPATAHWQFPPTDRAPLPGAARRVNLRELAARPGRFEHHLMVVATVGDAQLEIATASEPLYFAHRNISDEYALPMRTGDALADAMPFRVFVSDFDTGADVARINHRAGQLVLHPHGFLHWPARLRPPYATFEFAPGMRRAGYTVVFCGNRPIAPTTRPLFVTAECAAGPKSYAPDRDIPILVADTSSESERALAVVGDATMTLTLEPGRLALERGGYALVLRASGEDFYDGDLVYLAPGEPVAAAGIDRALVIAAATATVEPPPSTWDAVPEPPFAVYEDAPPGQLPVAIGGLSIDAASGSTVAVSLANTTAQVPRYWLARMLFRLALHGYALGHVETYGGLFYDDSDGAHRIGLRGAGSVELTRADLTAAVERLYRAVAPQGYVERLA